MSELDQPHGVKSPDDPASSRVDVDIASGMLAAHHKISVDEALVRLRALAFSRQCRITELAEDVLGGECFEFDLG